MTIYSLLSSVDTYQTMQIINLYRMGGWWNENVDNPELVEGIVRGSHCFIIAIESEQIIGMGRAISDGASDAYIQDVIVHKQFQNQGIGKRLVEMLTANLKAAGLKWIGLIAEAGSHPFYSRIGFAKMTNATPMVKIIP